MSIGPGRGAPPAAGNGEPGAAATAAGVAPAGGGEAGPVPAGPRRRAGGRLSRLPLWMKLTTVVACLTAAGLAALGVAGVSAFRGALLRQANQQVSADAAQLAGQPFVIGPSGERVINGPSELLVQLLSQDGERLVKLGAGVGAIVPPSSGWITSHTGHPVSVRAGGQSWRVMLEPIRYQAKYAIPSEQYRASNYTVVDTSRATEGAPGTLVVGMPLTSIGERVNRLSAAALGIGAAVTALVAALVLVLVRASMNTLTEAGELARAVTRGQRSRRLTGRQGSTEMTSVARSLNEVLAREEEAARARAADQAARAAATRRMSERLARAARQLHGPLSVISGLARQYPRRSAPTPAEADRLMSRVAHEAARMSETLDALSPSQRQDPPH